jgi:hypothetical protein
MVTAQVKACPARADANSGLGVPKKTVYGC